MTQSNTAGYSIHSVRGYIAQNVTKTLGPAQRSQDVYASLKLELQQAQEHLGKLRSALIGAERRERKSQSREVAATVEHQHCAAMHRNYADWCERQGHEAYGQYSFYAR